MRFHLWRCLGILSLGLAIFFLVVFQVYSLIGISQWEAIGDAFKNYSYLNAAYIAFIAIAAILLSVEEEAKSKGPQ